MKKVFSIFKTEDFKRNWINYFTLFFYPLVVIGMILYILFFKGGLKFLLDKIGF